LYPQGGSDFSGQQGGAAGPGFTQISPNSSSPGMYTHRVDCA